MQILRNFDTTTTYYYFRKYCTFVHVYSTVRVRKYGSTKVLSSEKRGWKYTIMILWEYFRKYLYNVVLYGGTEIHVGLQYSILEDRYESTTNVRPSCTKVLRKYVYGSTFRMISYEYIVRMKYHISGNIYFRKYTTNNYHTYTMCTCTSTRTDFVSISHTFVRRYCTAQYVFSGIPFLSSL